MSEYNNKYVDNLVFKDRNELKAILTAILCSTRDVALAQEVADEIIDGVGVYEDIDWAD